MRHRRFAFALLAVLAMPAVAVSEPQYPDWRGQWVRVGPSTFDPTNPYGLGQQAPLTPEYQDILEKSLATQGAGGLGNNPTSGCVPPGMPRMMIGFTGGIE